MVIVSQSKRELINFNNINLIGTDGEGAIRARLGTEDNVHLGSYDLEERAKEVLREITIAYKEGKFLCRVANNEWQRCNTLYEMPER